MTMTNTAKTLVSVILLAAVTQGCGWFQKGKKKDSGRTSGAEIDADSLVPPDRRGIGNGMSAAELALAAFNPAMAHACEGQLAHVSYQGLVDSLGGIRFGQTLQFYRNERSPYLVVPYGEDRFQEKSGGGADDGDRETAVDAAMPDAQEDSAGSNDPVDIKRADLIGRDGSKVLFLSKTHGLFFVETAGDKPRMTCTLMVPGEPKNFYIVKNHLILINNSVWSGRQGNSAGAVVVYAITDAGLAYKSHHLLENQTILDSRLFNDTLVTYAQLQKPVTQPKEPSPMEDSVSSDDLASGSSWYGYRNASEYIVTSFNQITETPKVVFEDVMANRQEETQFPNEFSQADVGKTVSRYTSFKDFISASDRYFVVTKEVRETVVDRIVEQQRTVSYCANYNPKARLVSHTYCAPQWEKVANPGFDANFSCHSAQNFAECVQANETKFVKAYWRYQGSSCKEHSYWIGRCERSETKTFVSKTPIYKDRISSHLMIYKYENGSFVRFDDPSGAAPIAVAGEIKEHKSFQFRDGYLMIVTSDRVNGSALRSWKLADKALVYAGAVEKMGPGEDLKAVLFTASEAFVVTFLRKDPLFRIDLNDPSKPVLTGKLDVEGFSSQLLYHEGKLIGIGQTAESWNDRVKVSLFEADSNTFLSEINSIALGSDMDHSYNNAATDDQLHHFVAGEKRLYVPYSGWYQRQASDTFSQVCRVGYRYPKHRLSIFHVGTTLVEESVLEFRGNIERVLEHQQGKALAFSIGSVSQVKEADGKFTSETVKELYQTEGIYRDSSLPEGMVVAKQAVRSGGQLYKLRFALATREQLIRNEPAHVVEVSDDLVSCLGNPQVQFFDNELFVGHNLNHFRRGYQGPYDRTEIQISGYLGWKISAAGFQPMSEPELAAHKARQPTYCWIKPGIPAPGRWEELLDHEMRVNELYECRQGPMEQSGQVLNL